MSSPHRTGLIAAVLLGLLSAGVAAYAGDQCLGKEKAACDTSGCSLEGKVTALLSDWEAARAQSAAMTDSDRARLGGELANVAMQCPVGSRVGATLATARSVLGAAIAAEEQCAGRCQAKEAGEAADALPAAPGRDEMFALMNHRSQALRKLHQLAGFAADFTCAPCSTTACDAGMATAEKEQCSAKKDCASQCPIQAAVAIGELKAKWAAVPKEVAAMTPEKKQEIVAGFGSLSQRSKAVTLVPASLLALTEGFETLEKLDAKVTEWADANPEFMKAIPAESRISFRMHNALIAETAKVLRDARGTMTAMCEGCPTAPAGGGTTQAN